MSRRSRLETLAVVRKAAVRVADQAVSRAASESAHQAGLAQRLDEASSAIALTIGDLAGGNLAARLELASRMRGARAVADHRANEAIIRRNDAAIVSRSAKKAHEAVAEAQRTTKRDLARQKEARAVTALRRAK